MANTNGWGDGASNNDIGWGQGADNAIGWGSVYSVSSAGSTDIIGSVPATPLLLDTYTDAAVAYSLRKLRTDYLGNAIRVRRSSDNAEQDIAFSGNDLDTASLLTFCGAGNGFITTWYDQSTNANNSTQATAANQAQIVSSGALILDAITGKITTTWTADSYTLTNLITTVQLMYHYMVFNRTSNSQAVNGLTKSSTTAPTMLRWFATTGEMRSYISTAILHSTNTATGSNLITTLRDSSNVVKMFRNNVALTTGVSSNVGATFDNWGNANASRNFGNFAELVHWNSDQEANRTGIETNVNTYWNAY